MTDFDERIRAGLNDFPAGQPRPLDDIQQRARTVQNRRRAANTGIVMMAAAAVAFPFAMSATGSSGADRPAPPAATASADDSSETEPDTEETVWCDSWGGEGAARQLAIDAVPEDMLLLWDDDIAAPPTRASASVFNEGDMTVTSRHPEGCTIPNNEDRDAADSVTMIQVEDDIVIRSLGVYGPVELDQDVLADQTSRTIPTSVGTLHFQDSEGSYVHWPAGDGLYWSASFDGDMSDTQLAEFAASVRLVDGEIDVSGWSGYEQIRWRTTGPPDNASADQIDVSIEGPVTVSIGQRTGTSYVAEDEFAGRARVGDEIVDINGRPGLLTARGGNIDFMTADDVFVNVRSTGLTEEELLAIARSIKRVPADDPRLAAVWQTEFDQQTD